MKRDNHTGSVGPTSPRRIEHLFTVDVEEYFHVGAFEGAVRPEHWNDFPTRISGQIAVLLDLLAEHEAKATFFVLGWVAHRHPGVVRRIAQAGHEIASHGYSHRRVNLLSREEFRDEVTSSKAVLEDVVGEPVLGFRAPNFSIVPGWEWAFDILLEEGYRYDSSLFPIRRPGYGYPSATPQPHIIQRAGGSLLELPMTTLRWLGWRLPAAGGGYLRQLPLALIRRAFHQSEADGVTGNFYIHPWEIDPDQPRIPVSALTRWRHYRGLNRTEARLRRLLSEFRFTSVQNRFRLDDPSPDRATLTSLLAP